MSSRTSGIGRMTLGFSPGNEKAKSPEDPRRGNVIMKSKGEGTESEQPVGGVQ